MTVAVTFAHAVEAQLFVGTDGGRVFGRGQQVYRSCALRTELVEEQADHQSGVAATLIFGRDGDARDLAVGVICYSPEWQVVVLGDLLHRSAADDSVAVGEQIETAALGVVVRVLGGGVMLAPDAELALFGFLIYFRHRLHVSGASFYKYHRSTQKHVEDQHQAKSRKERIGGGALTAVGVGLGDHFVADDVEHSTSREGEGEGEDGLRNTDGEVAYEGTEYLDHARHHCYDECATALHTRRKHRRDYDHTLGDILECDTARHGKSLHIVARSEADACGDALGQVMDGDGNDEKQDFIELCGLVRVAFLIHARHFVQVGDDLVDEIEADRAAEYARDCDDKPVFAAVFKRGQNEADHGGGQHYARGKGKNYIVEFVGRFFENEADQRADDRGTADPQCRPDNSIHRQILSCCILFGCSINRSLKV